MSKRIAVVAAYAVITLAAFVFASTLVRATLYNPEQEVSPSGIAFANASAASTTSEEEPMRILIPALDISARIAKLGVVAGNRMQVPSNFSNVGWYKYGAAPGAAGTAVLYGHYDNGLGLGGVFRHLDQIRLGDEVQIRTRDGKTLHFIVDAVDTYPYAAVPRAALGEVITDDGAHISLITCAGEWTRDPSIGNTYDKRLVVRATYTQALKRR